MANANASTGLAALAAVVEHLHAEELATAHAEVVAARAEAAYNLRWANQFRRWMVEEGERLRDSEAEVERLRAVILRNQVLLQDVARQLGSDGDEITRLRAQLRDAEDRARWWEARTLATLRHFTVGGDEADISIE